MPGSEPGGAPTAAGGACEPLVEALGLGDHDVVSLVGGGGKTAALTVLTRELGSRGSVIATTTTGMFLRELAAVAGTVIAEDERTLVDRLRGALGSAAAAAAARGIDARDKVIGLPPGWIDRLWAAGVADHLVVEADGSRNLPLKGFGPHEPVIPVSTTVIVHVAGIDAIGVSLSEEHVHRAEIVRERLGVEAGATIDGELFVRHLLLQGEDLRDGWPAARIVTLLNKVETADDARQAAAVAERLLDAGRRDRPDRVVVASLRRGEFQVFDPEDVTSHNRAFADSRAFEDSRAPADPLSISPGGGPGDACSDVDDRTGAGSMVSAVVLAAGRAERMGRQKVLLPFRGRPLVYRAAEAAVRSRARETVVVVGHEGAEAARALEGLPCTVVENPAFAEGMSTSLSAGLRAVAPDSSAIVVLLADQPFVSADLVDAVIEKFEQTRLPVVRTWATGRPAHPVLMSSELFPDILAQAGDRGGRDILAGCEGRVGYVPVGDPRAGIDVDTEADYQAALRVGGRSGEEGGPADDG